MTEVVFIIIGGFSAFLTTWIVQNKTLREGITNSLLKRLNKESIKKIALNDHKVFLYLKTYKSNFGFFVFNSDSKSLFYQTFIRLLFNHLSEWLNSIINIKGVNVETYILDQLNSHLDKFDAQLEEQLNIPQSIQKQFQQWRMMLIESLKKSTEQILSDDIVESDYFKKYRVLDQVCGFVNIALSTGAITFNQMNGAFDEIKVDDILKKKS
jgi:hypothetical protein